MNNELFFNFICEEEILKQLPGYLAIVNLNHEFTFCNRNGAYVMGFKNHDEALGKKADDMPCKAAECASIFAEQNQRVINTKSSLKILDIHPYIDDNILTLLTVRSPLFNSIGNIAGVAGYATEITQGILFNISMSMIKSDRKYRNKRNYKQRSYTIVSDHQKLTGRELECLFYLLRGKSMSTIAKILGISSRTVESHINNIKYKMSCNTKADIIEKAIDENFIDIIPNYIFMNNINISQII